MKKTIVSACVAASCLGAMAAGTNQFHAINWKTASADEYRAAITAMESATNQAQAAFIFMSTKFPLIRKRRDLDGLRIEFDNSMAAKGYALAGARSLFSFPKMSAISLERYGDLGYGRSISVARRIGCDASVKDFVAAKVGVSDMVVMLSDMSAYSTNRAHYWNADISRLNIAKKALQHAAAKEMKRKMREKGMSFVTKDGVNPCDRMMSDLNAALNAPRYAGLNEWLVSLGYEPGMEESRLPSEAEVSRIRNAVIFGDMEATEDRKAVLFVGLGVEGYNAFVKEYNGE